MNYVVLNVGACKYVIQISCYKLYYVTLKGIKTYCSGNSNIINHEYYIIIYYDNNELDIRPNKIIVLR